MYYFLALISFALIGVCHSENDIDKNAHQDKFKHEESLYIALIVDDLGYKPKYDRRALRLQGEISYAFLPSAPYSKTLLSMAKKEKHNIMLHLPMQAMNSGSSQKKQSLGPGTTTMSMNKEEFTLSVKKSIASIPFLSGVNNHMGSLLTRSQDHMQWLMEILKEEDLFFVDSRTSHHSIAEKIAVKNNIPTAIRNVFLDHSRKPSDMLIQFKRLIKITKRKKGALVIAHPFPETLDFLEKNLPKLKALGIELVSVSELIKRQSVIKN